MASCSCTLTPSASAPVASSSTSNWPARTWSPSFTSTRRTTPASSGCSVLLLSSTTMRPAATATMSICPSTAQPSAMQNSAQIAIDARRGAGCDRRLLQAQRLRTEMPLRRPGAAGRSVRAAAAQRGAIGRGSDRASSMAGWRRGAPAPHAGTMATSSARGVSRLQRPQAGIQAVAALQQCVVRCRLRRSAPVHHDDAVGAADRAQPMRNDDDRAALADRAHVALQGGFAFVVQRAGRLVEDQDPRIGEQCARDRDALPLAARQPTPCSPTMVS